MSAASGGIALEVAVGQVEDLPFGEGRVFVVGEEQVAVFRLRDGAVRAVQAICPHRGGPLGDAQVDLRVLICPLHLNVWSIVTGESQSNQPPIRTFPVRVDDAGTVFVGLPD